MGTTRIAEMLQGCGVAKAEGEGTWVIDEGRELSLLAEIGQGVLSIAQVRQVRLLGDLVEITGSRERNLLPAERIVALKLDLPAEVGVRHRTGFV